MVEEDLKERNKRLKNRVLALEKQKKILWDALDVLSLVYNEKATRDLASLNKALEYVQITSLRAMEEAAKVDVS